MTSVSKRTLNRFVDRAVDASGYTVGFLATAVLIIPVASLFTNSICWCAERLIGWKGENHQNGLDENNFYQDDLQERQELHNGDEVHEYFRDEYTPTNVILE